MCDRDTENVVKWIISTYSFFVLVVWMAHSLLFLFCLLRFSVLFFRSSSLGIRSLRHLSFACVVLQAVCSKTLYLSDSLSRAKEEIFNRLSWCMCALVIAWMQSAYFHTLSLPIAFEGLWCEMNEIYTAYEKWNGAIQQTKQETKATQLNWLYSRRHQSDRTDRSTTERHSHFPIFSLTFIKLCTDKYKMSACKPFRSFRMECRERE